MTPIRYSCQDINEEDIAAVVQALRSEYLTQGPLTNDFERAIAGYTGAQHGIVCSNATAALHCAMLALGVGPGDRVWTSPISFVASANCALYVGATVDFVDIDPATGNMDLGALEEKLLRSERDGKLPKAIIPVHFSGRCCDLEHIARLAARFGFAVVEDAAHAFGGRDGTGGRIGNCRYSQITVFSFHPVKSITTGEGGALTTNSPELAEKLSMLVSHGITREKNRLQDQTREAYYYEQQLLGFNYRMTELQAALGISQLRRLDSFIETRLSWAEKYREALACAPLVLPPPDSRSAWHLYVVRSASRDECFRKLRKNDVLANVHYLPIPLQPYYGNLGFRKGEFPVAERFAAEALSLPIHTRLTEKDFLTVVKVLTTT